MKLNLVLFSVLVLSLLSCSKDQKFDEREIHLISPEKISGFDPIHSQDRYTSHENGKVYEGLYEFHPLKRPYELLPNLAESLPTVSEDGLTYTVKLRKGVLFHDSPAFKDGKGRELVADDVIYSLKRLADPKLGSSGWWLLENRIVGLDEWRKKNASTEKVDYSEVIEGMKKIDSHTVQFKLKEKFPQFLYALAQPFTFIIAKEAVEHFGKEFVNHPVGTGAFILPRFEQGNVIVYTKNPTFREKLYPSEGEEGDEKLGLLADAGKKLPLVDKITVHILPEGQTQWLNIQKGKADLMEFKSAYERAVDENNNLHADLKAKGLRLHIGPQLDVTFYAMNTEDPILKNKKVRQAMNLAFDRAEANKLFYNNSGVESQGVIPPGLTGYRKEFKNPYATRDLAQAKKLLAEAGYPDGKGLPTINFDVRSETIARQQGEHFAKNMSDIGIKVVVNQNTWPELLKKKNLKQLQVFAMAWGADYPDAENFLGLHSCQNVSPGSNGANYCNPEFDEIFKKATIMQESPERASLYEKANEISALDSPWIWNFHRSNFYVSQPWLKNFKLMEFNHNQFQYLGVDLEVKKELSKKF